MGETEVLEATAAPVPMELVVDLHTSPIFLLDHHYLLRVVVKVLELDLQVLVAAVDLPVVVVVA
tara:strand:- start:550 stop:741 length:192 start_codon:yes stop_codon:yes gene_type:complete